MTSDPNVWRTLPDSGQIRREWLFVGQSRGQQCRIPVELVTPIDDLQGHYWIRPLAAMHVLHCPDSGVIGLNLVEQ